MHVVAVNVRLSEIEMISLPGISDRERQSSGLIYTPFRLALSERTRPLFILCLAVDRIRLIYLDVLCD